MELNECINFLLTKAQHTVHQYFKASLAKFDVTPVQYSILSCLWKESPQTPKQIAAFLELDGSTITGLLDRMEDKGLITRNPNPDDRRTLKVIITGQGLKLQKSIDEVIKESNIYILNIFSDEEQDQLKRLLERIITR